MTNEPEQEILSPAEAAKERSRAVEARTERSVALSITDEGGDEKLEIMREALGEDELAFKDFEVVKTPAGGGQNWELPDGNTTKVLKGVIIKRHHGRAFWKSKYGSADATQIPDCVAPTVPGSKGGVGTGDNGTGAIGDDGTVASAKHDCETCPQAQWGSARNDSGEEMAGQACQLRTRLFMYPEGGDSMLPLVVSLAPAAYANVRSHFVGGLGARGVVPHSEVTEIGLEQTTSKQGNIKYSKPVFKRGAPLDPSSFHAVDRMRLELLPLIESLAGRVLEGEFEDDGE